MPTPQDNVKPAFRSMDGEALITGGLGAALGIVFGLSALGERYRQRRLHRLGLWIAPSSDRPSDDQTTPEPL